MTDANLTPLPPNWLTGGQPTRLPAQLLLAAGVLVVVGVMLPWLEVSSPLGGTITRSGFSWSNDAKFAAVGGVTLAGVAVAVLAQARQRFGIQAMVASGIVVGLGVYAFNQTQDRIESIDTELLAADVGTGLYLTIGAAVLGVVAGFMLRQAEQRES